jgi:putative SOS response-associated peptidase YedK
VHFTCHVQSLPTEKANEEVAQLFGAIVGQVGNAGGGEVYPGYPGLVVAQGELRSMVWGFPLSLKGKNGQPLKPKPVNNARADKLDNFMWRFSFQERRCLIPVSAFAEAEGEKGAKDANLVHAAQRIVVRCSWPVARHTRMGTGLLHGNDGSLHPCSGRARPHAGDP